MRNTGRFPGRERSKRKRRSAEAGEATEPERSGFCRSLRRLNPRSEGEGTEPCRAGRAYRSPLSPEGFEARSGLEGNLPEMSSAETDGKLNLRRYGAWAASRMERRCEAEAG